MLHSETSRHKQSWPHDGIGAWNDASYRNGWCAEHRHGKHTVYATQSVPPDERGCHDGASTSGRCAPREVYGSNE